MAAPIDAFRYVNFMRSRWRLIVASCGIAIVLATLFSLIQTPQYTAVARIVIEPPAGSDLRAAMAISPIYLESLRTYEEFAGSDSQFQKAVTQLDLRSALGTRSIESLKKSVLKVALVRNTRILEISATLPDPRKAQALARFLAESTVDLNRTIVTESDRELSHGIEQQAGEARARLNQIDAEWAKLLSSEPVEELKAAMENEADLRSKLQQEALSFEVSVADAGQREKEAGGQQKAQLRSDSANAQARIAELHKQIQALDRRAADREKLLATRMAHRDTLEAERKALQNGLANIENRLRESQGESGLRGERLKVIDPGIVPERPSSPNLPLNLAAALLLGLVLPILYLALQLNFLEQKAIGRRDLLQAEARAQKSAIRSQNL
jgi:uncharacterized protein involved in exopolysaccharide biosynthesis